MRRENLAQGTPHDEETVSIDSPRPACPPPPQPEQTLCELITRSLTGQSTPEGPTLIAEITDQFARIDRRRLSQLNDGFDLVELKYAMSDWRARTSKTLLSGISGQNRATFVETLEDLAKLSVILQPDETTRLIKHAAAISSDHGWVAQIGAYLRQFGDQEVTHVFLEQENLVDQQRLFGFDFKSGRQIKAYYPIRRKLREWSRHESASHYEISADGTINYRGLQLRAGDLLVADLNMNHEGLYTSFVRPRSYATHSALVVLLQTAAGKAPAMLEIHKKGARIVPLSRFCAADFSTYLEAYRIDDLEQHTSAMEMANIVEHMLATEQLVYDFRGRPTPRDGVLPDGEPFVTCTTLLELVLRRAGVTVEFASSRLNTGARANLEVMGLKVPEEAFLPTDILRSEALSLVGILDNNRLRQNLIREAVMGHENIPGSLAHAFATRTMKKEALPIRHLLEEILIHSGQSSNLVARLGGFDNSQQIPSSAPVGMLALLMMANTMVTTGVKDLNRSCTFDFLAETTRLEAFSLAKFESMPLIRREIEHSFDHNKVSTILPP
jgi:hypothetical protein